MTFLEVDHVSKTFPAPHGRGEVCVFSDVAFDLTEGEFLTMVGHSGCGKSTLLNIIAGLERPTTGGVVLQGREIGGPGIDRMVVFQNFALMPWLTVLDNVRIAVRAAHPAWSATQVLAWAQRYVDMVGLGGAETKRPAALSGGMRQRVGLARAFSTEPKVLLLDEPFAQIDALTRGVIQDELVRMWTAGRNTVFMVTHDVDEAILLSDRIALMTSGPDARLAEILEVKIPRPRTRADLIDDPEYLRLRTHVLHFLMEVGRRARVQDEVATSTGRAPALARRP
jgi:nitrate/nitrite transport system ATP-binding protein